MTEGPLSHTENTKARLVISSTFNSDANKHVLKEQHDQHIKV